MLRDEPLSLSLTRVGVGQFSESFLHIKNAGKILARKATRNKITSKYFLLFRSCLGFKFKFHALAVAHQKKSYPPKLSSPTLSKLS